MCVGDGGRLPGRRVPRAGATQAVARRAPGALWPRCSPAASSGWSCSTPASGWTSSRSRPRRTPSTTPARGATSSPTCSAAGAPGGGSSGAAPSTSSAASRCAERGAGSYESWWAQHGSISYFIRDAHSVWLETLGELGDRRPRCCWSGSSARCWSPACSRCGVPPRRAWRRRGAVRRRRRVPGGGGHRLDVGADRRRRGRACSRPACSRARPRSPPWARNAARSARATRWRSGSRSRSPASSLSRSWPSRS